MYNVLKQLDPRPAEIAAINPLKYSVNIPCAELAHRTYELPDKSEVIHVIDVGADAEFAAAWLLSHGRRAEIKSYESGDGTSQPRLWSPNAFLEQRIATITPGRALDLACGVGREAVYLASLGWKVLAIDVLDDALERGKLLADRYAPVPQNIEWLCVDLSADIEQRATVDLVTMFYFLDRAVIKRVSQAMPTGSHLMIETFTTIHQERFGKPSSSARVLQPGEVANLADGFNVLECTEAWRPSGRHTAQLLARKEN